MTTTKTPSTKTEQLIAAAKGPKGVTAPELAEATGQTMQVIRSRIYSLTKAGRIEALDGSSPRRYRAVSAKKAPAKKAPAKEATAKK